MAVSPHGSCYSIQTISVAERVLMQADEICLYLAYQCHISAAVY